MPTKHPSPLQISRVKLKQIRCFDEIEFEFPDRSKSILLLGDNGDGKSTLLRSIAIGLCDESSAAALFRELPGEFVRRKPEDDYVPEGNVGTIEIDLRDNSSYTYRIVTQIISMKSFERVSQFYSSEQGRSGSSYKRLSTLYRIRGNQAPVELDQDAFPWHRVFVSGYGAGGRTNGTADFQHYLAVDALYSLFKYDAPLQNPELVIRRYVDAARETARVHKDKSKRASEMLNAITGLLHDVLNLKKGEVIKLATNGVELRSKRGRTELGEAPDGYQATVTWILDLLAWWLLHTDSDEPEELAQISGIVLIDEIEQHLHPKWQMTVVEKLSKCFPGIQFIASTHSPLVASGARDADVFQLKDGAYEEGETFGWLAEDVLRFMGIDSSRSKEFQQMLARFGELDRKRVSSKLNSAEKKELSMLRSDLADLPRSDPSVLLKELANLEKSLRKE